MTKFVLLAVALAACVAEPGDGSATETNVPRIIANALSPGALSGDALTTAQLTSSNAAAMGGTSDARKVLGYAAECALDATQTVSFTVSGTGYSVTGALGMVTDWTSRGLTWDEASWISACVFARVNLTATSVAFSARGAWTGLGTTSSELSDYLIEEGAFWGNAFLDLGALTPYACNGVDQAYDDSYADLPVRECAQPSWDPTSNLTPCGFNYAGLCGDVCLTGSPYADCAFLGGRPRAAVITAFLYGTPL